MSDVVPKQLLHLVFGGELEDVSGVSFRDVQRLDVVGIFPDYASARAAWKAKAQATVDDAHMRYFIVHLHRLLDPEPSAKTMTVTREPVMPASSRVSTT